MALFVTATLVSMEKQQDFQNETMDTFLDSVVLYLVSPCILNMHARAHAHTHTRTSIGVHTYVTQTFIQIKNLNICCLFELNCSFTRVSSDVHFVIVKSTSVATSFEVECGSFVQGHTHT